MRIAYKTKDLRKCQENLKTLVLSTPLEMKILSVLAKIFSKTETELFP